MPQSRLIILAVAHLISIGYHYILRLCRQGIFLCSLLYVLRQRAFHHFALHLQQTLIRLRFTACLILYLRSEEILTIAYLTRVLTHIDRFLHKCLRCAETLP